MTFSEKLVRLRKIKGITQEDLAAEVGVTRQAVYKWESGKGYPEVAALLKLKETFSISIDDLLDDTFEVARPEGGSVRRRKPSPKREAAQGDVNPTAKEVAPEVIEEPVPLKTEEAAEPVVKESRKGIFGRLFGRK